MPMWSQHLLVLLIVAGCVAFVARQMVRTFKFKKNRLGSCCAKGCDANATPANRDPAARVVFMPVEMLGKRARVGKQD